jgi:hypothetical protein
VQGTVTGTEVSYTVYHELTTLARVAAEEQRPFPLTLMHDLDWPYGRRDVYYAPERIPAEYRHPITTDGLAPFTSELVGEGGIVPGVHKAAVEGTPRNGVRTPLRTSWPKPRPLFTSPTLPAGTGSGSSSATNCSNMCPRCVRWLVGSTRRSGSRNSASGSRRGACSRSPGPTTCSARLGEIAPH